MKIKPLIFILLSVIGLLSCTKDEPGIYVLKTTEHNLHFSGNGGSWLLTINSNVGWEISGTNDWCSVNKNAGNNTDQIIVTVSANDTRESRSTNLQITGERLRAEVNIQQDTASGNYHYELPVVFHIIYSDMDDTTQNIKAGVITRLIEKCNQVYRNNIGSIDMNMELVAATHDKDGVALPVAGINRLLRSNSARQSCDKFLNQNNKADAVLLWDPNQYINIFIFTCTEKNLLGKSFLPYTPRQNSLIGLTANNTYYTKLPDYPHSIVLNNTYLYEENAYQTLAHELGHYLGLYHSFAEKDCATDTDYCDDTYSYNRPDYEKWLSENAATLTEQQRYQRTSCEGVIFTSRNTMDYDFSYMDQFTADQFLRIRHVLEHSPLIPGPKNVIITKTLTEDEIPVARTIE